VGALDALKRSSEVFCISLASPLDLFAVHRFLLILLYWKSDFAGGVDQVRESLLKDNQIPSSVLNSIAQEKHCFDLFDNKLPFLQDPSAIKGKKERKSAGSLFAELASGTNIAHFHHGDDENTRLCLPCTTLGMLRVVPWTQSGGAGLTPSIHNAPPITAIATGENLGITLGLNLVDLGVKAGGARWSGHFRSTNSSGPIPYLEAFTWNPRRICLPLPQQKGICWYCGQSDVPTIGPIVYLKNENTKSNKTKGMTTPFVWKDPSAFYLENQYKTAKSTREDQAIDNKDLRQIVSSNPMKSIVVTKNENHEGWYLIVPCTNPANNKTFDHRQLELASLPSTIRSLLPSVRPSSEPKGLDGWNEPVRTHPEGITRFVQAAESLLTHTDWTALSNAAYRQMNDSPAAFDVFSGLYWGLREQGFKGLPSRKVAWLMLKLMAAVPARHRISQRNANFLPLLSIPKRQLKVRNRTSPYPASFPRGLRLEGILRHAIDSNMRKRNPEPVDWIGLCHGLDQLLD